MKKWILVVVLIIVLLLDWAALDDITTGQEPSLLGEYFMVIINIPILLTIGYLIYRNKQSRHKIS